MASPSGDAAEDRPRAETLGQLLGTALAYVVMGAIALTVVDLVFVGVAGGGFGDVSGWVAAVPSVFVFTDRFRRYEGGSRWAVALVGIALALGAGVASTLLLPPTWPPLATGGVGGLVTVVAYSALWHAGIRVYGEERP